MRPQLLGSRSGVIERQLFIRVQIEHHPVWRFDRGHPRTPAVKFDRAHSQSRLAIDHIRGKRGCRVRNRLIWILVRLICDHPLRIALRRHGDVSMSYRVVAGLYPPRPVAIIADGPLASEADQIDLGVPLPVPSTNRTFRIQGPVSRLKRDDVESVGAVRSVAIDDVAGMGDRSSPTPRPNELPDLGLPPS